MTKSYAVCLGSLAMSLVILRGFVRGELAGDVIVDALLGLLAFSVLGSIAGWIADSLVRDSVEDSFRKRVDWYRQGLIDAGHLKADPNNKLTR